MLERHIGGTVAIAVSAFWLAGCAGDLAATEAGGDRVFRHRDLGYSIPPPPPGEEGAWTRFELSGADLAFRNGAASMSLLSRCPGVSDKPIQISARRLVFGLRDRELVQSGPEVADGSPAWSQAWDATDEGDPLRIHTVTVRHGACVYDFVLVSPLPADARERSFDRWWRSWRGIPLPGPGPESGVAGAPLGEGS